jgi:hypothetical protein
MDAKFQDALEWSTERHAPGRHIRLLQHLGQLIEQMGDGVAPTKTDSGGGLNKH